MFWIRKISPLRCSNPSHEKKPPGASLWHFLPPDPPPPPLGKNYGFAPDMTCFLSENQDIPIYFRIIFVYRKCESIIFVNRKWALFSSYNRTQSPPPLWGPLIRHMHNWATYYINYNHHTVIKCSNIYYLITYGYVVYLIVDSSVLWYDLIRPVFPYEASRCHT